MQELQEETKSIPLWSLYSIREGKQRISLVISEILKKKGALGLAAILDRVIRIGLSKKVTPDHIFWLFKYI